VRRAESRSNFYRTGLSLILGGLISPFLLPQVRADTALVFNEVMYHPQTNETAFEWVELYNQMAVDLDLSGWTITNGISFKFPVGTVVHGGPIS